MIFKTFIENKKITFKGNLYINTISIYTLKLNYKQRLDFVENSIRNTIKC